MSKKAGAAHLETASGIAAELRPILGRLKRRLREHGAKEDLSPSQIAVLLRLEKDGPATVSGLARAEGMRPQSMSAIVTVLLEGGLLSGIADASDGRKTVMSLSKRCERLLKEGRAARHDWLTGVIGERLSVQEQQQLSKALELLRRLADDGAGS